MTIGTRMTATETIIAKLAADAARDFRSCREFQDRDIPSFLAGYWQVAADRHPEIKDRRREFIDAAVRRLRA